MKILLDTHIALWAITGSSELSAEIVDMLEAEENEIFYSIASVWEIAIKHQKRSDQMPVSEEEFESYCRESDFRPLRIASEHIGAIKGLSQLAGTLEHKDPFDRLLIAQAKIEDMIFLTHDALLQGYNEDCIRYI